MSDDDFKKAERLLSGAQHSADGGVPQWQQFRDVAIEDERERRALCERRDELFAPVIRIGRDERLSRDARAHLMVKVFRDGLFPIANWFRYQRERRAKMYAN